MDEKQRVKVLAGVLGVVLLGMFLKPRLLEPIENAKRSLQSAERKLKAAQKNEKSLMTAQGRIANAQFTGLPPDPKDAQRLYQSWITNLAEQCRFAQLDVKPGSGGNSRSELATVDVYVEGETDLEGISRFLYLFEQAQLLHRISALEISSTGSSGKPRMEIKLTAEGVSMSSADPRSDVFARTWLSAAMTASETELEVAEANDFPTKPPFLIQVGREMIRVTDVSDNKWTIQRGQEGTTAASHPVDENVFQFPVAVPRRDIQFASYASFLSSSPFTKPAKPRVYSPRIASVSDKKIAPGESVEMTARAEDVNKDIGEVVFAIEGEDGMSIDPVSGKFQWETTTDHEAREYEVTFILTQKNNDNLREEKTVSITLELPNEAPTLTVPKEAVVVLGQSFTLTATADDDAGKEGLKFSLDGDVPDGAQIDADSGVVTWEPPKAFEPGDYQLTVKVTDGGSPAKSASQEVALDVRDDDALLTKFTGSVALDGEPIAWFRNIARKSRPELRIGDRITVAEIDAKLTEIAGRHVLMSDDKGIWKVQLGDSLRQRILVKAAAPPVPEVTEEKSTPESDAKPENDTPESSTDTDTNEAAPKVAPDYDKDPPAATDPATDKDSPTEDDSKAVGDSAESAAESPEQAEDGSTSGEDSSESNAESTESESVESPANNS